jgi:hypothetical protein
MNNKIGAVVLGACAVLLAGCANPETECRDGVKQMKKRTQGFVGMGQPDEIQKAIEKVSSAETSLATGNYEGCIADLKEAGALLNRSQRTNQQ